MAELVIDVQGLHKGFAGFQVLKGIDIKMMAGTTTVVLGGSGSGKTVLMKHIMGLFKPDKGRVIVDGEDVSHMGRQETPSTMRTHLLNRFQDGIATHLVQTKGA